MKIYFFHLMPYGDLDMGHREFHNSVWLKLPNSYFDPKIGHDLYNRYLDELELAAELDFDGVAVNEHHQNAYGLMPSPIVMASALARRIDDVVLRGRLGEAGRRRVEARYSQHVQQDYLLKMLRKLAMAEA